jgi:hypothetical protein
MNPLPGKADFPRKPEPAEVRQELSAILSSPSFQGSKRCTDLLSYLVEQTLEGKAKSIEEKVLAVEVFGRDEGGSPSTFGIVRVVSREVCKRLAEYYAAEGAQDDVRIDLAETSYVPKFRARKLAVVEPKPEPVAAPVPVVVPAPAPIVAAPPPAPVVQAAPVQPVLAPPPPVVVAPPPQPQRKSVPWIWIAAGVAALLAIGFVSFGRQSGPAEFNRFWDAAFHQTTPVRLVVGNSVDFGQVAAVAALAQTLGQHSRPVEVVKQADPGAASVFVGGGAVWSKDLRFRFDGKGAIADSTGSDRWSGDSILIYRVPGGSIMAAGLTETASAEAGRILANGEVLAALLKKLPPDWATRKLEMVLRTPGPGQTPELLSSHVR